MWVPLRLAMGEMSFAMVFWRCESLTKVCWLLAGVFSLLVFLSRRVLFVGGGCLCCFIWFKINAYDNPLLLYDFILRTQVRSNLLLSLCSVVLLWSSGAGIYSSLSVLGLRLSQFMTVIASYIQGGTKTVRRRNEGSTQKRGFWSP